MAAKRGISKEHDCVLVARDRDGRTFDFVPDRGAVTKSQLHEHLLPALEADILLVTDAHAAYRAFAREAGISHEAVNLRQAERVRGAVHVQNVNGYHRRFRQWLARFNGVASQYLLNYLGWRWALDGGRIDSSEALLRAALGSFNTKQLQRLMRWSPSTLVQADWGLHFWDGGYHARRYAYRHRSG